MVDDSGDIEEHNCRLLGAFGIMVQCILGMSVLTCLFIKFLLERDPAIYQRICCWSELPVERTFSVFILDVSKQLVASAVVHTMAKT